MICPYCEKEMLYGYIYNSSQPLQWIPEGKKPSVFSYTVADYAIALENKFSLFKIGGYSAKAYYCNNCKIVIAPTEE